MNRSDRMKIVQSVAEYEEREECRAMGESQKNPEDKIGRLEELNTYRQHWNHHVAKIPGAVAPAAPLPRYH